MTRATPALVFLAAAALSAQTVLVEAEGFAETGGWSVDAQFMDQMGSPYLLAHGMGVPVADARTEVALPAAGVYRVWVRTRDWVARWKAPGAPGRFQLLIDGVPVKTAFGTEGADWHWQDGGTVRIAATKAKLTLHDLTGFDGRCDAIVFSRDAKFTPPEGAPLAAFRRKLLGLPGAPESAGNVRLCRGGRRHGGHRGGGVRGAPRHPRRPDSGPPRAGRQQQFRDSRVSGRAHHARSEPRVGRARARTRPRRRRRSQEVDGSRNALDANFYADEKKIYVVQSEKTLRLFLNMHAHHVEKAGSRIAAVVARDVKSGKDLRFSAPLFADCTGDATIGFLAGADYRVGPGEQSRDRRGAGARSRRTSR